MRRSATIAVTIAILGWFARPAAAATEWVLILDNSTSMSLGSNILGANGKPTGETIAPADPYRLAVIATLIFRAFLEKDDKLTILTFDHPNNQIGKFQVLPNDPAAIRALDFNKATYLTGPLQEAKRILDASTLPKKVLLLVTDGAPTTDDPIDADGAKKILGYDANGRPPFEIISLGLATEQRTREEQQKFLAPLGGLEQITSPSALVEKFTEAYAASIRSRPESGTLKPGESFEFRAPKYVSDVMVALATVNRTGSFNATLDANGKKLKAIDAGDSGCEPNRRPCHAYQVFKASKSPSDDETWTISLPRGGGPVAYGIILRYELAAEIVSMSEAKAGEEKEVVARLLWKGVGFNDPAFFQSDGFEAVLELGDNQAPLTLRPDDGSFAGKITVPMPGPQDMKATFKNKWLTLTATRPFEAEAWLPLEIEVNPTPVALGSWTGDRGESKRCATLDFTGSLNTDKIGLELFAKGLPDGYSLERPAKGKPLAGNTAEVCVVAPGCCNAQKDDGKVTLVIRGEHEHYHPDALEVPLTFEVSPTPFLTCWWRVIAGVIAAIVFIIIVYGFIKPHDFDANEVIKLASKEKGLARAAGRRLRELPGGRRGFYRDAKVAFDGSGGAVAPSSGASLVLKATKNDTVVVSKTTIEHKDPRSRKWAPVDAGDGLLYLRRGVVYRVGEFYFRLG